jgi:crotonobetainyl-CoA:carnitine CoA-transferase CaiB-like acyl-CoA transferase
MRPLAAISVLNLGLNLPAPLAAARLCLLGATVVKVEPPQGDPLGQAQPDWYRTLHEGQRVVQLDLAQTADRDRLEELLAGTDLLLTSHRPAALARLGLAWDELAPRHPRLLQVSIVGFAEEDDRPGHDLTFQARHGLLTPPHLPRALIGDLGGAQEAVGAALALLLERERGQPDRCAKVSLADAVRHFAEPLRYGLTAPGGVLGGGVPGYDLYRTQDGWIALAALEPRFEKKLAAELGLRSHPHGEGVGGVGRRARPAAGGGRGRDRRRVGVVLTGHQKGMMVCGDTGRGR